MTQQKNNPTGEPAHDEPLPYPPARTVSDDLTMPMEDDPAGEGHMWSGKTAVPPTPESDGETQPLEKS